MPSQPTPPPDPADQLRASLLAIRQLKGEIAALRAASEEPVAVVGVGCRFPGGADSPHAFWRLLHDEVDAVTEVPSSRWSLDGIDGVYDPNPDAPGKTYSRHGAFLDGIDGFDASFFGISPREASRMDPQHRLALEVCWEALEDAAIDPTSLAGTATGVFLGISSTDYSTLLLRDREEIDAYVGSGNAHGTAAGRLSFVLGLQGPCLAVDTACSSSLVSVHLACQSLRARECDLALAGGASVLLAPEFVINFGKARMLAPDGRCKTFDAAADGYVRGEGCGFVVLRRLSDAVAAGDRVLAVVRGSAVNHDGRTSALTVPNGPAQERVVRDALARASLGPDDIGYVEAHGTGTSLGDPIEMHALARVFAGRQAGAEPVRVGSVKTNIGHLEAAAGIAGFIKAVLCVANAEIPRSLHFRTLNPHISLDGARVEVAAARSPWPANGKARAAGVSSFGFGGTNVHVVVAEPPARPIARASTGLGAGLLVLSARSAEALVESARRAAAYLSTLPADDLALADVCRAAQLGRAHFEHRLAVVCTSAPAMAGALAAFASGARHDERVMASADAVRRAPSVAFHCEIEGALDERAARALLKSAAFREALERCDSTVVPLFGASVLELLAGAHTAVDPAAAALATRVATTFALGALWRAAGISPSAVIGDEGGVVVACVSGAIEVEEALRAVADGRASAAGPAQTQDGTGASLVLSLGTDALLPEAASSHSLPSATVPSLRADERGEWSLAHATAALYVRGASIRWDALWAGPPAPLSASLPTYPFQRTRHWAARPTPEPRAAPPPAAPVPAVTGDLRARLAGMGNAERERVIRQHVRAEVARLLGYAEPALPDPDAGFFELGLDSLMALDLATFLEETLAIDLPETIAIDHPTISAVASHLAGMMAVPARAEAELVPEPSSGPRQPPPGTSDIARRLAEALEIERGGPTASPVRDR